PACDFYQAVFGYELEPMPGDMDYTVLRRPDGRYIGGVQGGSGITLGNGGSQVPSWTTTFAVGDADTAVRTVREGGGTAASEPVDSPCGRYAAARDPFGVPFTVMKPAPEQQEARPGPPAGPSAAPGAWSPVPRGHPSLAGAPAPFRPRPVPPCRPAAGVFPGRACEPRRGARRYGPRRVAGRARRRIGEDGDHV